MPRESPSVVLIGPTAAGKSELALRLAERFKAEIVNYDSVQVYRGFDIGAAKTPPSERRGVPHHLIDHVEPTDAYSAGEYVRDARALLARMRADGRLPLLAGGTGFYLEALLQGLFPGPGKDRSLRDRLRRSAGRRPAGHLWLLLNRLDPDAAAAIHRNDEAKLIRAIEVTLLGGQPMTRQWRASREPLADYRVLTLGLDPPRQALYERIEARTRAMFADGLVAEVQRLLAKGVPRTARPFGSLGYAQCVRYLEGRCRLEEAVESTALQTRRYAKRQMTWFRHRTPNAQWRQAFGDSDETFRWAVAGIEAWL